MGTGEDGLIGIPFPDHSSELLCCLNEQRRAGLLCDVTITSRGLEYRTHRAVLAAVSQYFRQLFTGSGGGGGCAVCQLDCVHPEALAALLEFAYTATLTIRSSAMREVLRAARLLGIQCVTDACRDILGLGGEEDEGEEVEREEAEPRELVIRQCPPLLLQVRNGAPSPAPDPLAQPREEAAAMVIERDRASPRRPRKRDRRPPPSSAPPAELPLDYRLNVGGFEECLRRDAVLGKQNGRRGLNGGPVGWGPGAGQYLPQLGEEEEEEDEEREGMGLSEEEEEEEEEGPSLSATPLSAGLAPAPPSLSPSPSASPPLERPGRRRKAQTPQQCPVCQKVIHGAGKLPRHMRTHTGEKPFQCGTCGVRFTRNDKLKIHMRKHTGERPYSCPHCAARFLHSYDLKNHLSLHSGDRPYECPLCHKAFARDDHLQRHLKGQNCLEVRTRRPRRAPVDPDGGSAGSQLAPPPPLQNPLALLYAPQPDSPPLSLLSRNAYAFLWGGGPGRGADIPPSPVAEGPRSWDGRDSPEEP
ncbi:zinc finger and BTB domain-containing protein 7B [Amia ocellicauda]|uniref:zinc finger and BTB domain-containing protein 7B n=1 Tax=Amia ocellicauda TaxID=2972642 RepID=UPI0034642251